MTIINEALAKLENLDVTVHQSIVFVNLVKIYKESYSSVQRIQNRRAFVEFFALHDIMLKFLNRLYLMFNPEIDDNYKKIERELKALFDNAQLNYEKKEAFFTDLSRLIR